MIALRKAEVTDAPVLAGILSDWIAATPWMPKLHSREGDQKFVTRLITSMDVTMAEDGAGFLARDGAEVDALYVAEPARRSGYGRALLDHAKKEVPRLELWTFQANDAALAFYAAHGFHELKRTDGTRNDEKLPDVRLMWERG